MKIAITSALVAQSEEREAVNLKVTGSSPVRSEFNFTFKCKIKILISNDKYLSK